MRLINCWMSALKANVSAMAAAKLPGWKSSYEALNWLSWSKFCSSHETTAWMDAYPMGALSRTGLNHKSFPNKTLKIYQNLLSIQKTGSTRKSQQSHNQILPTSIIFKPHAWPRPYALPPPMAWALRRSSWPPSGRVPANGFRPSACSAAA